MKDGKSNMSPPELAGDDNFEGKDHVTGSASQCPPKKPGGPGEQEQQTIPETTPDLSPRGSEKQKSVVASHVEESLPTQDPMEEITGCETDQQPGDLNLPSMTALHETDVFGATGELKAEDASAPAPAGASKVASPLPLVALPSGGGLTAPPPMIVLEPEDQSDAVPHQVCDWKPRDPQWNIIAASVRGRLHELRGLWRDDAYMSGWVDNWTIMAVADGAGSAKISRVGARIACEEAVKVLQELLTGYTLAKSRSKMPAEADFRRLRTFLSEGCRRAKLGILLEAQARQCPKDDLHATLLVMIHTPFKNQDLVGAIQVGDGALAVYTTDEKCTLLGEADHGEYAGQTRFLTTPMIEYQFDSRVRFTVKKNVCGLAVMSDGVAEDFFPEEKHLIHLFNGNPIPFFKGQEGGEVKGVMHEVINDPQQGRSLAKWLQYEKQGSRDDRTLVLMYRSVQS
jgi:serine/threonine protein phosphatase PrpC